MLEIKDVDVHYGKMKALHDIALHVGKSEIVAVIGSNGAGKSTTLKTIFGLLQPSKGTILFGGDPIHGEPVHQRARRRISYVPEGGRIFSELTVFENLELGAFTRKGGKDILEDVEMVFDMFPVLRQRMTKQAGTLSGGERQMLALGRSLMLRPLLVLLDEPSLGLGPIVINEVYSKIRRIRENGSTVLLVEQNARKALRTADRGYVYSEGKIVLQDKGPALLGNDYVRKAFLGA